MQVSARSNMCVLFLYLLFLMGFFETTNSEEPFLLPFGPKHGDTFTTKEDDTCSTEQPLGRSVRFGSQSYTSVFVCTNGYLSFGAPFTTYDPVPLKEAPSVLMSLFWGDVHMVDNLLDYMCLYSNYDQDYMYTTEDICSAFKTKLELSKQNLNHNDFANVTLSNLVKNWSEQSITRNELNIERDDNLTRILMGKETTTYINLANNLFKRQITNDADFEIINQLLSTLRTNGTFEATWGYVATWYKVGMCYYRLDSFNSYQAILTCGNTKRASQTSEKCFVIFDFYELQWTTNDPTFMSNHARSGFRASNGFSYELPSSGTPQVRNLWAESNFNHPGIWVFELDQTGIRDAVSVPEMGLSNYKWSDLCRGEISPKEANAFESNVPFTLSSCVLPSHQNLKVQFTGIKFSRIVNAVYDQNDKKIHGYYPDVWGLHDDVHISLMLDDVVIGGSLRVRVFSASASPKSASKIDISINQSSSLTLKWPSFFADSNAPLKLKIITGNGSDPNGFSSETSDVILTNGATSHTVLLNQLDIFTVFSLENGSKGSLWTLPIIRDSGLTCKTWANDELKRGFGKCSENLAKWYGCPRRTSTGRFVINANDAWFAHEEVRQGLSGWEYDICCNQNDSQTREELNEVGYCSNTHCEFNPGATFCIRSPRLACQEGNNIIYVSNKCCYDSNDSLIRDPRKGAGSINLEVNAMFNLEPYYRFDIEPYRACCVKFSGSMCEFYRSRRAPIIGLYWSRNIRFARGDPYFETIDGASYPFNGLGVYTMFKTTSDDIYTVMQISTRRKGNGTVFSGFVIKNKETTLEGYVYQSGTFEVAIDNVLLDLGLLSEYTSNGIFVKENVDRKEFFFEVEDVKVIVKAIVTDDYLNLMMSVPPTFHSRIKGLLGNYDGDVENDFTTLDGVVLPPDADLQTLHNQFGESYFVRKHNWLFQNMQFRNSIEDDIVKGSPFVASYDIKFHSDEEYNNVALACRNDSACIRDVALTKDYSFATNFQAIEEKVKAGKVFSALYHSNPPSLSVFEDGGLTNAQIFMLYESRGNRNAALSLVYCIITVTAMFFWV